MSGLCGICRHQVDDLDQRGPICAQCQVEETDLHSPELVTCMLCGKRFDRCDCYWDDVNGLIVLGKPF